jgi:hypothetical protein
VPIARRMPLTARALVQWSVSPSRVHDHGLHTTAAASISLLSVAISSSTRTNLCAMSCARRVCRPLHAHNTGVRTSQKNGAPQKRTVACTAAKSPASLPANSRDHHRTMQNQAATSAVHGHARQRGSKFATPAISQPARASLPDAVGAAAAHALALCTRGIAAAATTAGSIRRWHGW